MVRPSRAGTIVLTSAVLWFGLGLGSARAAYQPRFADFATGAITFTGNTLGLSKATNQNAPGTAHSIGTFITTDLSSRDGTAMSCSNDSSRSCTSDADCVAPATCVAGWPLGTTSDWRLSSSSAELRLPPGAQVLRAELVWSGTWAETVGQENVFAFLDEPVTFVTPLGPMTVAPDPASSQTTGAVRSNNTCTGQCFYTRSADVTAAVQAGGAGTYTGGGVPATQSTRENTSNAAGWTLAVVYEAPGLPVRNLTLFTAAERSGQPPVEVSGFCTPLTGTLSGRLAVSATEGDANQTGPQMLFGPTASLGSANRLSGPRNGPTNFFSSQITDDTGNLDVAGTFGTRNHTSPNNVSGGRQGWDIVNVDASARLVPGQTSAFAQGTTTGESYYINALALQIDVGAPRFVNPSLSVDKPATFVGDVLTYTLVLANQGNAQADNVVVFDTPPPGTTFLAGTLTINSVPQPLADPTQAGGVPLASALPPGSIPGGTIPAGSSVTVTYQVMVNTVPASPAEASYTNDARWSFDWVQCAGQAGQTLEITSNPVTTLIPRIEAMKEAAPTTVATGQATTFTITLRNTGTATATGTELADPIPAGTTYVPFSQVFNLVNLNQPGPVSGFAGPVGDIAPGATAVLSFQVTADPGTTGTITNVATVDPDGPGGPLPPFDVTVPIEVEPIADVVISKTGPPMVTSGNPVTYTLTVTNNGPSTATNVEVDDPAPANTIFASASAACAGGFPCTLGNFAPGASVTITVTFNVAPGLPAGTIIRNTATVTSDDDPVPGNDEATAETSIGAPVVNLSVTKTDGDTEVAPGDPVVYTIVVTNAGPDPANGARVLDTFPTEAGAVSWTCAPAASCVPAAGTGAIDSLVTILGGGSVTFTATAQTDPAATGQLVNTVTVASPPDAANPSSAQDSDTNVLTPEADVQATKTGPATVTPGGTVTYEIQVVNDGPSVANDVAVDDPTPAGLTLVGTPTGCPAGFPCQLGTLAPGAPQTITATYRVAPDAAPGAVTNRALVSSSTPDPDLTNNTPDLTSTVTPEADLFVTKTFSAFASVTGASTGITPGSTAQYVITVGNRGPSVATAVEVSDPSPPGLELISASAPCASGFPCTVGDIPAGSARTITVSYRVPANLVAPDPLENTATVTSPTPDPNPSDNTSTNRSPLDPVADIALEKTVDPPTIAVGGTVTYTVTVRNNGPSDASGIVVSDAIPAQQTLQTATPSAGTYDVGTGTWMVGALPAGAEATLATVVTVNAPGQISNVATRTGGDQRDPVKSNDSAGSFVNATSSVDLGVDIEVDNTIPAPNDFLTFIVTVTNRGPSPATGATVGAQFVCDPGGAPLPPEALVLSTPSRGSYDGATWTIGELASGQTEMLVGQIDLTKLPEGCISLRNQAVGSRNEPDANPANDRDSVVVTPQGLAPFEPVPAPPPADIQLAKGASNTAPQFGERLTFTITARNNGPGPADGVMVLDPIPDGVTLLPPPEISVRPSTGIYDTATGQWTVGALGVGESQTLALSVVVGRSGTIVNMAVLSAPDDPNPDNNTATSTLQVGPEPPEPAADLSITKTASPATVQVGEQITWTLAVSNAGPQPATGVVVTDIVPAQVNVDSATPSQGTCTTGGGQVTCQLGDVAMGAGATVTIVATRTGAAAFTNSATIGGAQLDPNPANNTATAATGSADSEDCGNCQDDDSDGLVDAEDPDCCTPIPLTVTNARYRAPRSRLRVTGTIADAPFAGVDPRRQDVRLQMRNADGSLVCCTLAPQRWQRLFGRTFGFFDQKMRVCPNVQCVKLALPASGDERATIILGRIDASTVASPLQFTLSVGDRCTQGDVTLRSAKGGAVFP